jgi:hypothetical protein
MWHSRYDRNNYYDQLLLSLAVKLEAALFCGLLIALAYLARRG